MSLTTAFYPSGFCLGLCCPALKRFLSWDKWEQRPRAGSACSKQAFCARGVLWRGLRTTVSWAYFAQLHHASSCYTINKHGCSVNLAHCIWITFVKLMLGFFSGFIHTNIRTLSKNNKSRNKKHKHLKILLPQIGAPSVFYINNLNCGWIFDQILSPEGPFKTKTSWAKQVLVGWAYAYFHVSWWQSSEQEGSNVLESGVHCVLHVPSWLARSDLELKQGPLFTRTQEKKSSLI